MDQGEALDSTSLAQAVFSRLYGVDKLRGSIFLAAAPFGTNTVCLLGYENGKFEVIAGSMAVKSVFKTNRVVAGAINTGNRKRYFVGEQIMRSRICSAARVPDPVIVFDAVTITVKDTDAIINRLS